MQPPDPQSPTEALDLQTKIADTMAGKRWQRAGGPQPWVSPGAPGTYDGGFVNNTVSGQLVYDGKTYIIYGGRPEKQSWYGRADLVSTDAIVPQSTFAKGEQERQDLIETLGTYPHHGQTISTLILREDGWAQLKPTYESGKVITRQFVFEGDTLQLNADAYGGYLHVEILDPFFKLYEGFSAAECNPITTDDPNQIWHTARWKDNADLRTLWNKPVRLVFHLHQASLYSFQFIEKPN